MDLENFDLRRKSERLERKKYRTSWRNSSLQSKKKNIIFENEGNDRMSHVGRNLKIHIKVNR